MKVQNKIAAASLFLVSLSATVAAGPFGLDIGMKSSQLPGNPEAISLGFYKLTTVPKPHSSFKFYVVKAAPGTGVCWIKGIGHDVETTSYGIELQSAFNEMKNKLEAAYGKNFVSDFVMPDSIFDEPNDWMMSLIKKERLLAAEWYESVGSELPTDIESITLMVNPSGYSKGFLALEYYGNNKALCDTELKAEEDDAL